jgi:hypothetical protein
MLSLKYRLLGLGLYLVKKLAPTFFQNFGKIMLTENLDKRSTLILYPQYGKSPTVRSHLSLGKNSQPFRAPWGMGIFAQR